MIWDFPRKYAKVGKIVIHTGAPSVLSWWGCQVTMIILRAGVMSRQTAVKLLSMALVLFCGRVLAQHVQSVAGIRFLPPFEAWHSGTLPYSLLLVSQILIIIVAGIVLVRVQKNLYDFSRRRGAVLLWLGNVYFLAMFLRFILGLTVLSSHTWFGSILPAIFHMVLAGFLIVLGVYELTNAGKRVAA